MPHELILRPEAEAELAEAFAWYEARVQGLGEQFLLSVDAVLEAIGRNPGQFPLVHKTVRRALLHRFPYSILFVDSETQVAVLAVFHAKRDPKRWRNRGKPSKGL